jgi:sugar lactone lactonase YvrE
MAALLILLLTPAMSWATYSWTFGGNAQVVNTGGSIVLSQPAGIVVDSTGDIFITDTANSRIVEVNAFGVASVLTISGLSPALSSPTAITIDNAGNLYVADTGNDRVVEVSPSGVGSAVNTGSVNLAAPAGVALDQAGDLFIADTGNSRIVEVTSGGSAAALSFMVASGSASLNTPVGLAEDTAGKLYIADSLNNRIVVVAAGSSTGAVVTFGDLTSLLNPSGVAVDRIGNVFVADTGNNRIAEVDTAGNGNQLLNGAGLGSVTLNAPLSVALDVFGGIYIADSGNSRSLVVNPYSVWDPGTGAAYTSSLNKSAVGFGHVQLGALTGVTASLTFTVEFNQTLGSTAVRAFTFGTENLDFTVGSDTSCDSSSVGACSVEIAFLPTAPGLRTGAVVLYDSNENPVITVLLYGFGDSPIAVLAPNTGSVINTGSLATSNPYEIALDGTGNIYVGDYSGSNVTKIAAGGGSAAVVALGSPGSTSVKNITGVALDGSGNLFIGDHQNHRILVDTPGGVVSVLNIAGLSPALGFPTALAFDAGGNLYIADFTVGRIIEVSSLILTGSTSTGIGTVVNTGSFSFAGSTITGMTVDLQGNIYIAARTQNNSKIIKVTPTGVASALVLSGLPQNDPGINNPQGVAVDAMGNIYIVDTANNRIVEINSAGTASILRISGLSNPSTLGAFLFGVTLDPTGNLYISDWTNNRIVFVNVSGAALTFASTKQGLTSTDSPKTATVTNLGNQPLIFSADPTYTASFANNSADSNPCTSSTSLSSGMVCDVSLNFIPQSVGNLSASIAVTNNTLNVASSTQQVSVSGIGTNPGDTTVVVVTSSPAPGAVGQPLTITTTVSDTTTGHTSTVPTGPVTFTDTVGSTTSNLNGGSAVNLSAGKAVLSGATLTVVGTHTITATYAGVTGSFIGSVSTLSLIVTKDTATIAGPATQPVPITFGQAGTVTITLVGPYSVIAPPSGSVTYTILSSSNASVASGTLTLTVGSSSSTVTVPIANTLAPGTYTISLTYSGDANNAAIASPTTVQILVSKNAASVALSSSQNPVLVTNSVTFTATVSGTSGTPTGSVSFYDGTTLLGSGTVAQGVALYTTTTLAIGAHSITAVYSGDSTFATQTSTVVTETVQDFALSLMTTSSPSATVLPGGTATYLLALGPVTGATFPSAVTLSVSGLPPGATATLSPQSLPAGSGLTNVTLTVQVPNVSASVPRSELMAFTLSPIPFGMLLLPFAARIRRRGRSSHRAASMLTCLFVLLVLGGLAGCGSIKSGYFGQSQQTYAVTVTGTSGVLVHSTTVTLTVQ